MTTSTNWPDPARPGVPMFPERDGWHALDTGQFIHVWHWYAKQKWWERKPNTDIAHEPKHFSHFLYFGPVLTPAQIAEMLAAERERCAKVCDTLKSREQEVYGIGLSTTAAERTIRAYEATAYLIRRLGAGP